MTRAQDVRAMTNGWNSKLVAYGAYTGRAKFKERGEWVLDQMGRYVQQRYIQQVDTTLLFDPIQLPLVQDTDVVVTLPVAGVSTQVTYTIRQVRARADGLLSMAILAKA